VLDINSEENIPLNKDEEQINDVGPDVESTQYHDDNEENQAPKEDSRFKDGDKVTMIRVRFPGNARSFPFLTGKRKFNYGQKVVAMSDRGMTVGYINSLPYEVTFNKSMLPVRSISKLASDEDVQAQKEFRASEKKAEVIAIRLIEKYQLDMILTHIEFTQFGKKAVFYFNAPARVDFRELVKDLVYELKMRIELRQISVRDRAAALGSVGACGMQTCCSTFLKNYGNVSIKMAKNQNLALIPSKLNGVCGQIKCCIKYEDEVYTDKRKNLPKEGQIIKAKNGDIGKVLKLSVLVEQFEMLTDRGARRNYSASQYTGKESEAPTSYKFPESFEHIVNETQTLIV
jgi:cell fate regulator YaaT (PSP1 superfamily)